MCHHIKPQSVDSYLSGICNKLEAFYPNVREIRRHTLVKKCLDGCRKLHGTPVKRKRALSRVEIASLSTHYGDNASHDDLLWWTQVTTGFHALMRLGELVWADNVQLQDYRKVSLRGSVQLLHAGFAFDLPSHKADRFFEGSRILVQKCNTDDDACTPFRQYLASRDHLFPYNPELWLRSNGTIPTRAWFIRRLRAHFPDESVSGHSLRAGGATMLAEMGIPPHIIQAIGRWASEAFQIYIRKHPALLAALVATSRR